MTEQTIFKKITMVVLLIFATVVTAYADKIAVTTSPATAKIFVDGKLRGTGSFIVDVGKKDCVTVEIREEGYLTEVKTYCNKRGYDDPPKSEYVQLKQDEALSAASILITSTPQTAKI